MTKKYIDRRKQRAKVNSKQARLKNKTANLFNQIITTNSKFVSNKQIPPLKTQDQPFQTGGRPDVTSNTFDHHMHKRTFSERVQKTKDVYHASNVNYAMVQQNNMFSPGFLSSGRSNNLSPRKADAVISMPLSANTSKVTSAAH